MQFKEKPSASMLAVILTLICSGIVSSAAADDGNFYTIRVEEVGATQGGLAADQVTKDRLTRFVERVRTELMVGNLGEANVGCDRCGELAASEQVEDLEAPSTRLTSLKFLLNREASQLEAFVRAYHYVQAGELAAKSFSIEIDGKDPGGGACPTGYAALGCAPRPICIQTSSCDKPYGGTCSICK